MFSYIESKEPRMVYAMMQNGTDINLIDVREPAEFAEGHADGAISIPLARLDARRIREQLGDPAGKQRPLYLICTAGVRAEQAAHKLRNIGLENTVLVNGGTEAWSKDQLPMTRAWRYLSLERQTQALVGIALVALLAKALLLHPAFYVLIGILGIGMIATGITTRYSLSGLVARLPWNRRPATEVASAS